MANRRPIVLVGGGTGGHIMPLIAVGEQLSARKIPFLVIGNSKGREQDIFTGLGWQFYPILTGKWRREVSLRALFSNLIDLARATAGFFQAALIILRTGARVVFSKGGPVSLPVVLAARILGCRIFIHESDTVMGLANRIASRFANRVFTAFSPRLFQGNHRYRQVGVPIRKILLTSTKLKIPQKSQPIILIIGGIQGSEAINSLIGEILKEILELADLVHLTGEREINRYQQLKRQLPVNLQSRYRPYASLDRELPYYFRACNLVVSRAGATTLAEASLFGKAMFLIPLPSASGNHQERNAQTLAAAGAVEFCPQAQLTGPLFLEKLSKLLGDSKRLEEMGGKLREVFPTVEASEIIVQELINA